VGAGYGDKKILKNVTMRIDPTDRIALIGVNGNGKSTFAKLLAGDIQPMGGEMRKGKKLEIAHFAQHQMDKLHADWTPFEHVVQLMPYDGEAKRRSRLSQMGLTKSRMDTLAKNLSGGERARLLMGLITFSGPGMLILDEPTNHLDIDSRDALVAALNDYEGAVLIISHDRHLVEATCDTLWIAADGTIKELDEDLDSYQRSIMTSAGKNGGSGGMSKEDRKKDKQEAAARRAELAPLRKAIKEAEENLANLKRKIAAVERTLGEPATYNNAQATVALGKDKAKLEAEMAAVEENWLVMSDEYEEAQRA
jgi:ATP-binding cassette subfamily F protein 3